MTIEQTDLEKLRVMASQQIDECHSPNMLMARRLGSILGVKSRFLTADWPLFILLVLIIEIIAISISFGFDNPVPVTPNTYPHYFGITLLLLTAVYTLLVVLATEYFVSRSKRFFQIHLIKKIQDMEDFKHFETHLQKAFDIKRVLTAAIVFASMVYGLVLGWDIIRHNQVIHQIGLTITIASFILNILVGMAIYVASYITYIFSGMSYYKIQVFRLNPRSSVFIDQLLDLTHTSLLLTALGTTYLMGCIIWYKSHHEELIPQWALLIAVWIPSIIIFLISNMLLNRIIMRTRNELLEELQEKIDDLYTNSELSASEDTDSISKLLDLHDKIYKAPNSALSISGMAGLAFSLVPSALTAIIVSYGQIASILTFLGLS